MSQCQSVTKNKQQCTRNALPRRKYCWQHDIPYLITLAVVFGFLITAISLWADLDSLGFLTPIKSANITYQNLVDRGKKSVDIGQYDEALNYFSQALTIVQKSGNRSEEGAVLNNIGSVYWNQDNYDQAIEYHKKALVIAREVGDRLGEGSTLNNIGSVYSSQGNYDQAIEYHKKALVIMREVGDRLGEGIVLNNIGLVIQAKAIMIRQ